MAKASEESVAVYLRMPVSSKQTLEEMARHLDLKVSTVSNALFRFVTQPAWFDGWQTWVDILRSVVERENSRKLCLHDFSADEWQARKQTYERLSAMGLIEEFDWRPSVNHSRRIICSFKISDTGRVIAHIFKETGITDPIEQDQFDEAMEAEGLAS